MVENTIIEEEKKESSSNTIQATLKKIWPSLTIVEISDETDLGGTTWSEMKAIAMQESY